MRRYPVIDDDPNSSQVPVSFVVVRFSDDYEHNILRSPCVSKPVNQLVTVDNRRGLRYDTLSAAINAGLDRTEHDLIVVVHEDVLLQEGWQARLQRVLASLEQHDPNWGLVGSVGWDADNRFVGHWSDPRQYTDTLEGRDFAPVRRLDEQILIFRRSMGLRFDEMLPSIHNIGRDLASTLSESGRRIYAVNAPTIHKYADERGHLIQSVEESPKIQARNRPPDLAERQCSDEYLYAKWPTWAPDRVARNDLVPDLDEGRFGPPVILLSRGGSGSRLLSTLAGDLGVFRGNDVNLSGDSIEMVEAVYRGVFSTYQRRVAWQRDQIVPRLRAHAARMLGKRVPSGLWGFKLPESLLILPALDRAFPNARFVHLIRDPLATCLRRTHLTARFDNAIGRTAIRAAYDHCGRAITEALDDSPALHMAYTTRHQIEIARAHARTHLAGRYLEIRFEDLLADPSAERQRVADWLGADPVADRLCEEIDPDRAGSPSVSYTDAIVRKASAVLRDLRAALGYV